MPNPPMPNDHDCPIMERTIVTNDMIIVQMTVCPAPYLIRITKEFAPLIQNLQEILMVEKRSVGGGRANGVQGHCNQGPNSLTRY